MRAINQGGSLAGFIIVGVLLTLVLVGGLYGLNRYNNEMGGEEVATEEQAGTEEKSSEAATDRELTSSDDKKETIEAAGTGGGSTDPGDATPAPATTPSTTSSQLPQTGPTETLYGIAVLSLLAFAAAHYIRSRSLHA